MIIKENIKLDITPETLIGDLFKNFPQLENKLIEIAPVFKKLKNPVLRRTVAKVTTLKQAAVMGNVSLSKMINELREAAGLDVADVEDNSFESIKEQPGWIDAGEIINEYDAREDLENGIHPAAKVTKDILKLNNNEIFLLITPFVPAPLIKIMEDKGFKTFTKKEGAEFFKTYVGK